MRPGILPFSFVVLATVPALDAQAPHPSIGEPAPPLQIGRWLDGRPGYQVDRHRAALLVFWAPWCGSCVAEFPQLNRLIADSSDLGVEFVAITAEPQDKVEALLSTRELHARVALDDDGKTFQAYGVRVLPRLVLVDPEGKVAALPRLDAIDTGVLRKLAAGDAIDLPEKAQQPCDLEWDRNKVALDGDSTLAHVWIERSTATSGGVRFPPGHGRITADGVGFANLVQVAYGAEPHEVVSTHPRYDDFEHLYRVSVKAPDDRPETARAMLREQISALFPFRAEWVEVEEPTSILRRLPGAELRHLQPSEHEKSSGMARTGAIHFEKVAIDKIVAMLGDFGLGGGVIDETGLSDYDIDFDWTPGDRKSFEAALRDCGLAITTEPRTVRKLKVEPPQ